MQDPVLEINSRHSDLHSNHKQLLQGRSGVTTSVRMRLQMFHSNSVHAIHSSQNTYLEALRQEHRGQSWDLCSEMRLVPEELVYQQASDAGVIDICAVDSVQNHPQDSQALPNLPWPANMTAVTTKESQEASKHRKCESLHLNPKIPSFWGCHSF